MCTLNLLPCVPCTGTANVEKSPGQGRVSEQMVRRTVRDRCAHHIAGSWPVRFYKSVGQGDMYQSVITRTPRDALSGTVFAALSFADEDFDGSAFELLIVLRADLILQGDKTAVAFGGDRGVNLVVAIGCGRAGAR